MTEKKKKITRLLPCPSYDIERVESWLSDMTKEGLLLDKRSPFGSAFMRFLPSVPQAVRYRLEPKAKGMDFSSEPPPEARELAVKYGWEFVCPFEEFYIYRTVNPNVPEMNTDTIVQSASLKRLTRQLFLHLLFQALIVGNSLSGFWREPYRFFVVFGSIYASLFLLFFTGAIIYDISRVFYIFRLHRKLKNSTPTDHNKPWKPRAALHKFLKITAISISALTIFVLFAKLGITLTTEKPSTLDSPIDPPFPTVSDLYSGKTLTSAGMDGAYNRYEQLSSNCCDLMLDWREFVNIDTADGQDLGSATMLVQYYDTAAPWLARGLANDFLRRDTQWHAVDGTEILPAPDLGLDYVACYKSFFPSIILQHGDIMVQATLSDEELLLQWAEQMAQQLLNNS